MTYWHIAVIILHLSGGGELRVAMPFPDEFSCGAALPLLVEAARLSHEADGMCTSTDLPSGTHIRPVARRVAMETP
jgi:hypothetical protein